MPDAAAAAAPAKPGDGSTAGVEQLRSTAKWLATALAGVAALLLAGIQLTSLGKSHHLGLAVVGAALAIGATGWAIWRITRVLTPETILLSELPGLIGGLVEGDRTILKGSGTNLGAVIADYEDTYRAYINAWNASEANPDDADLKAAADAITEHYKPLYNTIQFLRGLGLFAKVKEEFNSAVRDALICGAIAAFGIGLFAYAVTHKPTPKPTHVTTVVAARPSPVVIGFSKSQRAALRADVGKRCATLKHRRALAIGGTPTKLDVVVLPIHGCAAFRLTFTPAHGIALARQPVKLPAK